MARPATGTDPHLSFRLPEHLKDEVTRIAAREGITRTALLVRILTRFVETYPLDDID